MYGTIMHKVMCWTLNYQLTVRRPFFMYIVTYMIYNLNSGKQKLIFYSLMLLFLMFMDKISYRP